MPNVQMHISSCFLHQFWTLIHWFNVKGIMIVHSVESKILKNFHNNIIIFYLLIYLVPYLNLWYLDHWVNTTKCCWHFLRVTQTDREYGLMSSSKIGLVKITCHESLHSSHDVEFLHSYQQSYTSSWDKLLSPQCIIFWFGSIWSQEWIFEVKKLNSQ